MNLPTTPFFIVNTDKIDSLYSDMESHFKSKWPEGIIGYSFKTNNFPWIISYMKSKGLWAETVSADEYDLAMELGYKPNQIILNGPVKDHDGFLFAIKNGSIVNIDSNRELQWLTELSLVELAKVRIGLRVNFCIEDYCPGESQCGADDGRFGFSYETGDLKKAIDFLLERSIPLSGLHLHCSSKTRSLNIYKAIAQVACEIIKAYDLTLDYIDVGGGFFGGVQGKPTFKDYFDAIYEIVHNQNGINANLIIEPGMSLIGASVDYHTSVIDVKTTKNNTFAITDGSRTHIDPLMKKSGYTYEISPKAGDVDRVGDAILCGFTCMEGDRFFKLNDEIAVGDRVIFKKVGAYTMGLSPQFIEFYPTVYAKIGDEITLIRKKVTAEQFNQLNN